MGEIKELGSSRIIVLKATTPPPPPPNFDQVVVIVEKQGTAKSLTENPHRVRGRRKRLKISNHSLVVPWTMGPKDD